MAGKKFDGTNLPYRIKANGLSVQMQNPGGFIMLRIGWVAILSVFLAMPVLAQVALPINGSQETQTKTTLPDPLTPQAVDALVSRLSDQEVRALLLSQLNTQAEPAQNSDAEATAFLERITIKPYENIVLAVERLPILFEKQREAFSNFYNKAGGWHSLGVFFGFIAVSIVVGLLVERLFGFLTRKWRVLPPYSEVKDKGLGTKLRLLVQRFLGEFLGVLVFLIVARSTSKFLMPPDMFQLSSLIMPYLVGLPRIAYALSKFLLAPTRADYRVVHTDDITAKALCWHQTAFALLIGITILIPQFNAMHGVPMGTTRLGFWLNLAVHLYIVFIAYRYSDGLKMMMRGHDDELTPAEARVADFYPVFTMIVAIGTWWMVNVVSSYGTRDAFALLSSGAQYWTMAILIMAPAIDTAIRGLVNHLAPPMIGEGPVAERAHYAAQRSLIRTGRVIVFGIELVLIARIWGMTPASIASAGVGERIAAEFIEFLIILAIGYLIYELVSLIVNQKLAREQTIAGVDPNEEEAGGEGGGAGGSRLSTVLPLVLASARVAIFIIFVLLALSAIGVDTTPLLAGAGIVGLAIGFGAQKLVTDVVSGVFFLIDDAFRTGEYVEVDGTMGTVEKISIRSMQLRHHRGPVHTIPYGEIPKLTNYSRDWVIMKLKFTVPFDTDPNKVKKIFKKIGADMLEDPLWKDDFLQPFKSQGVFEIDDVGMVMRGKFMAKPGKQFTLRKEIYNKVKTAFEENGIDFARREVRVAIPGLDGPKELEDHEKAAISAAASQAAEQMAEPPPENAKPGD